MSYLAGMVLGCLFSMLAVGPEVLFYMPHAAAMQKVPARNKTVVEMTNEELRKSYSKLLSRLDFDDSQKELDALLKKTGEKVDAFFRDLSNTLSKEQVKMWRVEITGRRSPLTLKSDYNREDFQYLIMTGPGKAGGFLEDRTDKKSRPVDRKGIPGFMMSSGFAGLCLYVHPVHQVNSVFRYLGRESREPRAHVIGFAQKTEAGDYLSFYSDPSASTRLLVQGFVWIDPVSFQVSRMHTHLLLPESPTTLKEVTTDVLYEMVEFKEMQRQFWLPREVDISWEFPDCTYRNQHRYSDYRLFSVSSEYQITQPKAGE